MDPFTVKGRLQREVEAILMDMGVKKWDDRVPRQLSDLVHREAVTILAQTVENFHLATGGSASGRTNIDRADAELAREEYMEHCFTHPYSFGDDQELAADVNALPLGSFPTEPGVHLPPEAFVASNWKIVPDFERREISVGDDRGRVTCKYRLSDFSNAEVIESNPTEATEN